MASAVVPNSFLFGKHQIPLQTATSFYITAHRKQDSVFPDRYQVTVFFNTIQGMGAYDFKVNTFKKTEELIERLCQQNIQLHTSINAVRVSLAERKIDLIFSNKILSGLKKQDSIPLNWGERFEKFHRALGFGSPHYKTKVTTVNDLQVTLSLEFQTGDLYQNFMKETLLKLNRLFENNRIACLLKGNSYFQIPIVMPAIAEHSISNDTTWHQFDLTEDTVESQELDRNGNLVPGNLTLESISKLF